MVRESLSEPVRSLSGLLRKPACFSFFNRIIGAGRSRSTLAASYIRAQEGDKILDIGSGTSDILRFLPHVEYTGFDLNAHYIETARRRHSSRGLFLCRN